MSILIDMIRPLARHIRLVWLKKKWRKKNSSNFTVVENEFPQEMVSVGNYTYGPIRVDYSGNGNERLVIGSFCSIANNVKFLTGGGHTYTHLSTYPFRHFLVSMKIKESTSKGIITICDDVWIGHGSTILSGITIGQGAIIGAGSVVAKDIPPYAIYAGNKVIKYRFTQDIIDRLLSLDYSKMTSDDIRENIDLFYSEVDDKFFESDFWKKCSNKSN
ncbi:CatB-related O-acetyltransferase [Clostridium estertheticum]|uniref:CatB-related O-acetyltransferase n=1 Tax=Clostridium estertheticum TaxID=238834 RepID=UPI001C0DF2CD|nr:CatB-related O-acetyltransferase [Clostridium estertheticum]MBU3183951.1 CatB-related O-acetyltransferase [Clostridium estertheticum]